MKIVLFGGGSFIVEVEQSCARLGLDIVAIVKNVPSPDYALARDRIVLADDIGPQVLAHDYFVPIFTPGHRFAAKNDATNRGFKSPALIVDPRATVADSTALGAGSYVNSGATIGAASKLGAFVFVNRGASIGHHAEIADFASIGPGAVVAGETKIGRGAVIGAGAIVLPAMTIGRNSAVGAGAVVTEPIPDRCLVVGNPARIVNTAYAGLGNVSV